MMDTKTGMESLVIDFFLPCTFMKTFSTQALLVTAFFEGGAVMACEVLGAKMLAPYYGNSLYVWAGALGITLAGLAGGYFAGSFYSGRKNKETILFAALLTGATAIAAMPLISSHIVNATLPLDLKAGIILSCIALLFVPLFCFGLVSPLIISCIGRTENNGGRATGNVYAISTTGGIIFTIVSGFVLIPSLGLMLSACLVAAITAFFPLAFFARGMLSRG